MECVVLDPTRLLKLTTPLPLWLLPVNIVKGEFILILPPSVEALLN